jgi:hypothetical protein
LNTNIDLVTRTLPGVPWDADSLDHAAYEALTRMGYGAAGGDILGTPMANQERITAVEPLDGGPRMYPDNAGPIQNGIELKPGWTVNETGQLVPPAAEGDIEASPEDDPEETAADNQIVGYTEDGVPIYSGSTTNRNKPAPYPVKGGKVQKGAVATGLAAGSLLTSLPLNFLQKPANYLVNRLRNAPYSGEPGAAMQRMQDNAANRSSSDNQAAQQQAQQALAIYYELLYAGLIPNDGTLGNNGTPYPPAAPPSAPSAPTAPTASSADQLALIYNTFV